MLESALEDMERDANAGLTIFLNHSYNVPEDVGGMVTRAKMGPRGVDGQGNPNYDLDFEIEVNRKNERAVKCWEAVEGGHKLGLSIGAMIPDGGALRDKKTGALQVAHVKLLETSIVGIPANPRSWIQNAVRGIEDVMKRSSTHQLGSPTLTLDGDRYVLEGSLGDLKIAGVTKEELEAAPPAGPKILEVDPEVLASICGEEDENRQGLLCSNEPAHEGGHSWDTSGEPQGVAPDAEKARVQVITIDTDDSKESSDGGSSDSSQGAGSDPGDEGEEYSAPAPDVVAAATDLLKDTGEVGLTQLQGVLDLLKATAQELVDTKRELGEALAAKAAAESERDSMVKETGEMIAKVSLIAERLGDIPMGRKTGTVVLAKSELGDLADRLEAFGYTPGAIKLLTSSTGDKT